MITSSMPEGSFVLRTSEGKWLDHGRERYWLDVREARACAKGFSRIHSGVRAHLYLVRDAFPWWVETWLYGCRTVPIRAAQTSEPPLSLRAAA